VEERGGEREGFGLGIPFENAEREEAERGDMIEGERDDEKKESVWEVIAIPCDCFGGIEGCFTPIASNIFNG
jgi:hypothetical protein